MTLRAEVRNFWVLKFYLADQKLWQFNVDSCVSRELRGISGNPRGLVGEVQKAYLHTGNQRQDTSEYRKNFCIEGDLFIRRLWSDGLVGVLIGAVYCLVMWLVLR